MALTNTMLLGVAFGILSMVSYGVIDLFSSMMSRKIGAISATFWYFVFGAVILAAIAFAFFRIPSFSPIEIMVLVVATVFSLLGLLSFYKGLESGSLSIVAPVSGTWSVITVLAGLILLRESLVAFQAIGIVLMIGGAVLTSFKVTSSHP